MALYDIHDVATGDCKAINTPRTAEEVFAVRNLRIPAELVREGVLTLEQMELYVPNEVKVVETISHEDKQELIEEVEDKIEGVEQTLEEIQLAYLDIVGAEPPVNKKNNVERLKAKILSIKA